MKTQDFFEAVYNDQIGRLNRYKQVQQMTDNFEPQKLQMLCDDFDKYLIDKRVENKGTHVGLLLQKENKEISVDEYNAKVSELNKPIIFVRDFFTENSVLEQKREKLAQYSSAFNPITDEIDVDEYNLTELRNSLIDLKKKHIVNEDSQANEAFRKIFRTPIGEPKFSQFTYWQSEQKKSNYSKDDFFDKLYEAYRYYDSCLKMDESMPFGEASIIIDFTGDVNYPKPFSDKAQLGLTMNREHLSDLLNSLGALNEQWFLKKNDIQAELRNKSVSNQQKYISWLKSDDSLKQFINALKEQSLIKARETEAIINNHFKPYREQHSKPEPIVWLNSNSQRVLVYLFRNLYKKYFINPAGKKWQLVSEHFIKENGKQFNSNTLTSEAYNQREGSLPANGTNIIDNIIKRLSE